MKEIYAHKFAANDKLINLVTQRVRLDSHGIARVYILSYLSLRYIAKLDFCRLVELDLVPWRLDAHTSVDNVLLVCQTKGGGTILAQLYPDSVSTDTNHYLDSILYASNLLCGLP